MPREGRFDYLFEPLDVEESVTGADRAKGPAKHRAEPTRRTTPVRMAFAALALAALGVAAVVAVLVLQQPNQPGSPDNAPAPTPQLPTSAANTPTEVVSGPPPPPAADTSESSQPIESGPTQQAVPEPQAPAPTRTSAPRAPQGGVTNSPATRAPISVAPETRAPFPNQEPRTGDSGGGLLGGLL